VISLIDQDDIDGFRRVPGIAYELHELWDGDASALLNVCKQVRFDERPTLVHCSAGLSRSVSLVAYHLCREGIAESVDDAYALIAEKKMIRPHKNFVKMLRKKLR
jgi:protein-tyrosine phosphatase